MIKRKITLGLVVLTTTVTLRAEPFLAAEFGYQCQQCHINPTGGGLRNAFGTAFSLTQLGSRAPTSEIIPRTFGDRLTFGLDARGSGRQTSNDDLDDNFTFSTDRVNLYLAAELNESITIYLDQQISPGGSLSREAWGQWEVSDFYFKGGRMVLPFGIRIEDDTAFIRQITNINFNTADIGIELGHIGKNWNAQFAVTNGNGGTLDNDDGKQLSGRVAYVQPGWRLGASIYNNNTDSIDRTMFGVFATVRTGPVTWLFEYDQIEDEVPNLGEQEQILGFVEAALKLKQGHYVKFNAEFRNSKVNLVSDAQRYRLEYHWFPFEFTQLRFGAVTNHSEDDDAFLNEDEVYVQVHLFL